MNDRVTYAMAADYKSYELRQVIADLKDMTSSPDGLKAVKPYWQDLFNSAESLKDLLNKLVDALGEDNHE